ncbi:hypothetical protein B0H11DRAFT_2232564 [Mycena galericulata]|nr:hypothetical protein B0H11DRAFT_2232564 [Mycena galericulata]
MVKNELDNISSAACIGNITQLIIYLSGVVSLGLFLFLRDVSPPKTGVRFAAQRYKALLRKWRPFEKKHDPKDAEEVAETGRQLKAVNEKLEKQLRELKNAGRWQKLLMLHWGICAVLDYKKRYQSLAASINDFDRHLDPESVAPMPANPCLPTPHHTHTRRPHPAASLLSFSFSLFSISISTPLSFVEISFLCTYPPTSSSTQYDSLLRKDALAPVPTPVLLLEMTSRASGNALKPWIAALPSCAPTNALKRAEGARGGDEREVGLMLLQEARAPVIEDDHCALLAKAKHAGTSSRVMGFMSSTQTTIMTLSNAASKLAALAGSAARRVARASVQLSRLSKVGLSGSVTRTRYGGGGRCASSARRRNALNVGNEYEHSDDAERRGRTDNRVLPRLALRRADTHRRGRSVERRERGAVSDDTFVEGEAGIGVKAAIVQTGALR